MFHKFKDIICVVVFILFVIFIIKSGIFSGGLAMEAEREAFGIEKSKVK